MDWLTPNETETQTLLQRGGSELRSEDVEKAAQQSLKQGCRNVLLKLGERGCYVALGSGERTLVPTFRVKAVDTTAAGDAFNGAFATALLRGSGAVASVKYAAAVAAISVSRHGAQPFMPTQAEVDASCATPKPTKSPSGTNFGPSVSKLLKRDVPGQNMPGKASNATSTNPFL